MSTKKAAQLGMPYGTAANKLRKMVLFDMLCKHGENVCFRCEEPIETAAELSIEHKKAWLDVDAALFWDLSNIAFSHQSCNSASGRRNLSHGIARYRAGCRCDVCLAAKSQNNKYPRQKAIRM